MKYKIDKYKVYSKKRRQEMEILVFPKKEYMWVFDPHPGEDTMMIDGNDEAFVSLAIAYAILAQDPTKIIFFPIRNAHGIGDYYKNSLNLVMMRPELQFRKSEWFTLKDKLDHKHQSSTYVINYDEKKLNDYWEKLEKEWLATERWKKAKQLYQEEVLGDTLFMIIPRYFCYENHNYVSYGLEKAANGEAEVIWCSVGRILSEQIIPKA